MRDTELLIFRFIYKNALDCYYSFIPVIPFPLAIDSVELSILNKTSAALPLDYKDELSLLFCYPSLISSSLIYARHWHNKEWSQLINNCVRLHECLLYKEHMPATLNLNT